MKKQHGNPEPEPANDPVDQSPSKNQNLPGGQDLPEDQDLITRLKKGQQWAFNELVRKYQPGLLKIAYSISLNQEESLEVVQDVFMSVHKNIATFRQDSKLSTWLRKITINHCLNWKRKWKRRFRWHHRSLESENDIYLMEENKKSQTPEMLVRQKQMEKKLMDTIKKLPEKNRIVFVLSTFEGMSYEQIGQMLNIKKGTVSSRLHSARTLLKDALES